MRVGYRATTPRLPDSSAPTRTTTRKLATLALLAVLSIDTCHGFHASTPRLSLLGRSRPATPLHAAGAAAAVIRERLIDGEREGTLVVSTGRFPLIGLPSWSPPLHVGVLLSVAEKGNGNKGKGSARGGFAGR